MSHELRISTPQDKRVRGLLGFFYQKQYHDFYQEFGDRRGPRRRHVDELRWSPVPSSSRASST